MPSLYDHFEDLELDMMIVTETWFYDCAALTRLLCNAREGEGLQAINYVRKRKGRLNIGGGVSVFYKQSKVKISEYKLKRKGHEMVVVRAKLKNNTRPMFVISAYMSTRLNKNQSEEFLGLINEGIHKICSENKEPYIVIAGDFNKWQYEKAYEDFGGFQRIVTGPTRGNSTLDVLISNFSDYVVNKAVLPPLKNDENDVASDHGVVLFEFALHHVHEFQKTTYWARDMRKSDQCIEDINTRDWKMDFGSYSDPDKYVEDFHDHLITIMDKHIPLKKHTRKSTDEPWFNEGIGKKVKQRQEVFRREGRSRNWKELKSITVDMTERSRKRFYDTTAGKMKNKGNVAYSAVRALKQVDGISSWQPQHMRPENTTAMIGEEMADFYAKISQEFTPLQTSEIGRTYDREKRKLTAQEIGKDLKGLTLPKSYVTYDPPPSLLRPCADTFAELLMPVLNRIGEEFWWPSKWKSEEVTVIPKKPQPESFDECRNISCTSIFSKLAESYMIQEIRSETELSTNQYGGSKGSGTTHLLCDITTKIMTDLETPEYAVSLMAVDFAKAFNRMSHQQCIDALIKKGASNQTIQKVAAFLRDREMRIRQGQCLSGPRRTPGGAPQGTKSGNLLFSLAADHIGEAPIPVQEGAQPRNLEDPPTSLRDLDQSVNVNYHDNRLQKGTRRIEDTMIEEEWERNEIEAALQIEVEVIQLEKFKYVDDLTVVEPLPLRAGISTISTNTERRTIHAQRLQEQLTNIEQEASDIGMKLHPKKTQLVCVSPAIHSKVDCYIKAGEQKVASVENIKILGYYIGSRPNADAHVKHIKGEFIRNCWSLRHLRRARLSVRTITNVYCGMVRSAIEYSSVVYGGFLTQNQSDEIERLQAISLKIAWGWHLSYEEVLQKSGLETLEKRRRTAFERFTMKAYANPRYRNKWFPRRPAPQHALREERPFIEEKASHDRLKNSPIFRMRRLLNDKAAKGELPPLELPPRETED